MPGARRSSRRSSVAADMDSSHFWMATASRHSFTSIAAGTLDCADRNAAIAFRSELDLARMDLWRLVRSSRTGQINRQEELMRAFVAGLTLAVTAAGVHAAIPDLQSCYVPAVIAPKLRLAGPDDKPKPTEYADAWQTDWTAIPPRPDRNITTACGNEFRPVKRGQIVTWRLKRTCPHWRAAAFSGPD